MSKHKQLLCTVLFLGVALLVFVGLYTKARYEADVLKAYNQKLEVQEAHLLERLASKDAQLSIKRQAYDALRKDTQEKMQEDVELVRQLDFYRLILAPEEKKKGLALDSHHFKKVGENGATMTLTLVNFDKKHNRVSGELTISVLGLLNGQQKRLSIKALLQQGSDFNSKVSFKFYVIIEERLVFPSGFVPTMLQLSATLNKKPHQWKESIDWVWEK